MYEYNDYELLSYISENNEEANEIMFKKYEPLVKRIAQDMMKYAKNSGIELNDFIQEGMLGLNKAIQHFNEAKDVTFFTYAQTCIKRKMIDLIVSSNRNKNKALNNSIPIEYDDDEKDLYYLAPDDSYDPEKLLLIEEKEKEIMDNAKSILTDMEYQVFELKLNGFNYKEISEILEIDNKKIDNTLQRIRNKMRKFINK